MIINMGGTIKYRPFIMFEKGVNMRKRYERKKKSEIKDKIIKRQIDEIETLKKTISDLKIDCDEKDKLIVSINTLRNDLLETVNDLRSKGEEYNNLIKELTKMKNVMNELVFKRKWKFVRLLIR